MLTGIDHIVIAVNDLDKASAAFGAAGFTVTPGGSHPTGTHNALIGFADGSYLELIAVEDPELARDHPWFQRMGGKEGFVTFAIRADSLDYELKRLASRGLKDLHRREGARTRPDGQQVQWLNSAIESDPPVFLPFLIQDVTDRDLRVPSGKAANHENGALGTTGLTIVTGDIKAAMTAYGSIFSAPVAALDHGFEGVQQAWRYFCEQYWIDLVQPPDDSSPLAEFQRTYGDGIYQIYLTVDSGPEFPPGRLSVFGMPDLHILTTD